MSNKLWDKKQQAFRAAIKEVRTNSELTQVQLAKKLKKPQSYVSKYETGERKLEFVEVMDICSVCGISMKKFADIYSNKL